MRIRESLLLLCFTVFLMTDCSTFTAKYRTYERNMHRLKALSCKSELTIKENGKKELTAVLRTDYLPGTAITGEIKKRDEAGNDFSFVIQKIKLSASSVKGYNFGECTASGSINFKKEGNVFESLVIEKMEVLEVLKADIRYNDYYYRGNEGKKRLQERINRITETVKFLKTGEMRKIYSNLLFKTVEGESFKKDISVILFPEIYGFENLKRKNLLDEDFDISELKVPNDMILIDEMIWRKSYTNKIFPEILQKIRNSGSMFRDYEEALDIFFILYNLDYYFDGIINNCKWNKIELN